MAESRVFQKVNGVTVDGIGRSVQNFLRSSKGLVVQGGKAGEGYVVQAKDDDSWKKVAGMASAIEVQISDVGNGILVNIGNAQWSDKIGAGVIGWFVFAPLAVTSIVGTVQQQKLPGEIFAQILSMLRQVILSAPTARVKFLQDSHSAQAVENRLQSSVPAVMRTFRLILISVPSAVLIQKCLRLSVVLPAEHRFRPNLHSA